MDKMPGSQEVFGLVMRFFGRWRFIATELLTPTSLPSFGQTRSKTHRVTPFLKGVLPKTGQAILTLARQMSRAARKKPSNQAERYRRLVMHISRAGGALFCIYRLAFF